jgi:hypothetical protein
VGCFPLRKHPTSGPKCINDRRLRDAVTDFENELDCVVGRDDSNLQSDRYERDR